MRGESCEVVDSLRHIIIHLRHYRGDHNTLYISSLDTVFPKSLFQFIAEEGDGLFLARLEAPSVSDITFLVCQSDHDGRVADVYQNVHGSEKLKVKSEKLI